MVLTSGQERQAEIQRSRSVEKYGIFIKMLAIILGIILGIGFIYFSYHVWIISFVFCILFIIIANIINYIYHWDNIRM